MQQISKGNAAAPRLAQGGRIAQRVIKPASQKLASEAIMSSSRLRRNNSPRDETILRF
jgi:hypothetical protein